MVLVSLVIGIGGMLLQQLFAPKPKNMYGPRLSDINVPSVSPGNPIVRVWGSMKLTGQLIWTSRLIETVKVEKVDTGGKGGKKKPTQTTYTYSVDCAIAVCRGPVQQINRIWANQKVLWLNPELQAQNANAFDNAYYAELDRLVNQAGVVDIEYAYAGAFFFAFNNYRPDEYTYATQPEALMYIGTHLGRDLTPPIRDPNMDLVNFILGQMLDPLGKDQQYASSKVRYDQLNIYLGSDEQLPNAKIESYLGVGNVPAFREVVYFVMHNLQLEDFGNAIPTFTVEVQERLEDVQLYEIVSDICSESGLAQNQYDTLSYIPKDQTVQGFAITASTSGREAIGMLQKIFPFDAAETNYKLMFQWINYRPQAILRREDFAAHMDTDDWPASEEMTRTHDHDFPKRINFKFQEPARAYSTNTVFATRQLTDASTVEDVDCTVAVGRGQAKTMIEEIMALRFTGRKSYKYILPRKYVVLEPGDACLVRDKFDDQPERFYMVRLIEVNIGVNGLIEAQFVDHNFHKGIPVAETSDDIIDEDDINDSQRGPLKSSRTVPYMMDLPLITDSEDDTTGFYATAQGNTKGWAGGTIVIDLGTGGIAEAFGSQQQAPTTGANWYSIIENSEKVAHGFNMGQLGTAHPEMWDHVNVIRVFLSLKEAEFESLTKDDLLGQMLNFCLVGDELLQFADAKDMGNGNWELRTLRRGLRGTEWAIGKHQPGERFIRLSQSAVRRITHETSLLQVPGTYRAMTFGDAVDDVVSFQFTNTGNSHRPRAPQVLQQFRDGNDVKLTWVPRVRQNGNLISGSSPSPEFPETYYVDVMDGSNVAATHTVNGRSFTYTAAMQSTDLGAPSSSIKFNIRQIGIVVPKGFPAEVTV